ncbi:hypothetical protein RRV45_15885 [Bacillus sp. DTU_2020_1000418_1_SI_GHA_SEK_038]|uniref:hypothetical protein n=1 Tax=Bacillus sp. DTU_2020_1000418_1_SI_GHA_SEK_038 TaxID=3077585 RepID=UPI0028ED4F54|nr:hypothetical protein [Bacillus sp. DTU_2020_1000418_1_SI_GHA_SEK_038]WNS74382.1 hypothetical protein RRV45_15885 [Bacillus sp. DTU_2020_1000418_1_SI_GHA_SEK_038]
MSKDMMESLVNKVIKINRGGPETGSGTLLGVKDDYLILLSENDGVVYFKNQHIKSLTESPKKGQNSKNGQNYNFDQINNLEYMAPDTFEELLEDLRYQWVTINRGGPEKVEGMLHDTNGEFVALFCNEELLRLSMYHIRSISYGVNVEEEESNNDES